VCASSPTQKGRGRVCGSVCEHSYAGPDSVRQAAVANTVCHMQHLQNTLLLLLLSVLTLLQAAASVTAAATAAAAAQCTKTPRSVVRGACSAHGMRCTQHTLSCAGGLSVWHTPCTLIAYMLCACVTALCATTHSFKPPYIYVQSERQMRVAPGITQTSLSTTVWTQECHSTHPTTS
jgi:hypothetical protein